MQNRESPVFSVVRRKSLIRQLKKTWILYLFLLPSLVYLVIFHYAPLYGVQIAFRNFKPHLGIWNSKWVGWKHFETFFSSYNFSSLLCNTLGLSIFQILVSFPLPILFALILHYCTNLHFKKIIQTVSYAPHFISTVVLVGMCQLLFAVNGPVNLVSGIFGNTPVNFLGKTELFQPIYVWSGVWQNMGWNAILYISVLTAVSPELHEAAVVDGANKFQRVLHIDIPSLLPTAIIMLILSVGNLMSLGFEKAYLLQNDANLSSSELISTYVYKIGIQKAQYSYSSAIGLFNNVINFVLLLTVNRVARSLGDTSLW